MLNLKILSLEDRVKLLEGIVIKSNEEKIAKLNKNKSMTNIKFPEMHYESTEKSLKTQLNHIKNKTKYILDTYNGLTNAPKDDIKTKNYIS